MDIVIAILVLVAVVLVAGVGYRFVTQSRHDKGDDRPVGDTAQAHDEINPHDLPLSHPGREEAEEVAGGADGTTRGPLP